MKIRNILFTILMMGIVLVVYLNIDKISNTIKSFLVSEDESIIPSSNEYKRTYSYARFNNISEYRPINYYYNILNNGYTDFTFYCDEEYINCKSDIKKIAHDDVLLSKINNYVHPFNSFSNINTSLLPEEDKVRVTVSYKYSDEKIKSINEKVDEVLDSLKLDGLSSKEKIEKVHDFIIDNTKYDNDLVNDESKYDSTSAYGSLIEGYGVCSGYSDAMAIFLDRLDIPNLKISSDNHIWNLVSLDGEWLHLDLTWDDTENKLFSDNYFLITKEKLFSLDSKEHNYDTSFYLEAK